MNIIKYEHITICPLSKKYNRKEYDKLYGIVKSMNWTLQHVHLELFLIVQ